MSGKRKEMFNEKMNVWNAFDSLASSQNIDGRKANRKRREKKYIGSGKANMCTLSTNDDEVREKETPKGQQFGGKYGVPLKAQNKTKREMTKSNLKSAFVTRTHSSRSVRIRTKTSK